MTTVTILSALRSLRQSKWQQTASQVDVGENEIKMTLDRADAKKGQAFLQALLLHLNLLSEDYEGTIQVNLSEVYNNA